MKTLYRNSISTVAFIFTLIQVSLGAQPTGTDGTPEARIPPSKDEIRALLFPISFDMPSKKETANMDRIVKYGPSVLPIMADLLGERNVQADLVNRILVVANRVKGDKSALVLRLRDLLRNPDRRIRIDAISALQAWGSTSDCQYLLPLVAEKEESVRIHAMQALSELGDRNTGDALRIWLSRRENELTSEEKRTDSTLKYGHRALSNILGRVSRDRSDSQQVPGPN